MNSFTFNGINSADLGLRIDAQRAFDAPRYDVSMSEVPGRDGDVLTSGGRFTNINVVYQVHLVASSIADLESKIAAIYAWLYAGAGEYHELYDTYNVGTVRRAAYFFETDITTQLRRAGTATLTFYAQPWRYLIAGQTQVTLTNGGTITNPTTFQSLPLITLTGAAHFSGTFTLANDDSTRTWTVVDSGTDTSITCDSELMTWSSGTHNHSRDVRGEGFPELIAGETTITWTGGITGLKITPRWRKI